MKNLLIKKNQVDFYNQLQLKQVGIAQVVFNSRKEFLENPKANSFHLFGDIENKHTLDKLKQKIVLSIFFSRIQETPVSGIATMAGITDIITTHHRDSLCSTLKELKSKAKANKLELFCFDEKPLNNHYFAINPREIVVKYPLPAPENQTQTIFSRFYNVFIDKYVIQTQISIKINPKNTFLFIKKLYDRNHTTPQ